MTTTNGTKLLTQEEHLAALRVPFKPEAVGKLPRITCPACRDSSKKCCEQGQGANQHRKARCDVCGQWMTTAHIHLDFVGHADVTDRLLSVDPLWDWEPLAYDETGLPLILSTPKGPRLWIKLTVCGMTRKGVGSCAANKDDVEKELISDALRNAAMRFGVALDLWSKGELESQLDVPAEEPKAPAAKPATAEQNQAGIDEARRAAGGTIRRPSPARKTAAPDVQTEAGREEATAQPAQSVEPDKAGGATPAASGALRDQPANKFPPLDLDAERNKLRGDIAALPKNLQDDLRAWLDTEKLPHKSVDLDAEQLGRVTDYVRQLTRESEAIASEMRV